MADALPAPMPRMTRNQSSSNLIPRNASNVSLSALGQRVMSSQDLVKMSELLVKYVADLASFPRGPPGRSLGR